MYEWVGVRIKIEVVFLYIFTVIPLAIAQPVQTFFKIGCITIPHARAKQRLWRSSEIPARPSSPSGRRVTAPDRG